jgi:putative GTP pyrophosphokinase
MILERKMQINIPDLKQQVGEIEGNGSTQGLEILRTSIVEFAGLFQVYNSAMMEVSTKLEILDDEFHIRHSYNPIHHLECRIKGIRSIRDKMLLRGVPLTIDSVREHIQDIAGIRVICNFVDDIY